MVTCCQYTSRRLRFIKCWAGKLLLQVALVVVLWAGKVAPHAYMLDERDKRGLFCKGFLLHAVSTRRPLQPLLNLLSNLLLD